MIYLCSKRMYYLVVFIQILFIIYLLFTCVAFITGAPFVPTNSAAAVSMITLADIKRGDRVYDLGSGNGKLLVLATRSGAKAVGYEINPLLVIVSLLRGTDTRWKNFWHADIHDADIIFVYLLPNHMDKLQKKLKTECKAGTIIVSNSFIFHGWNMIRQDTTNHIYVFRV